MRSHSVADRWVELLKDPQASRPADDCGVSPLDDGTIRD
jgi:hypothetical protein